jgi:wyosine [tRNA(Phe)-imidazoG37] synthetase (radical SAM superfamily)
MSSTEKLTVADHSRDAAGLKYVYPVISRRAGGVSIGINLNPNNKCNWRCIYCQVPELGRGNSPKIDVALLDTELKGFLRDIVEGDFLQRRVPEGARRIADIAISGNGEPTSARAFPEVVECIAGAMAAFDLTGKVKLTLITNGSLMGRDYVQRGIARLSEIGGEIWFKFDRALVESRKFINGVTLSNESIANNLRIATTLCPTWIQTCVFALDGDPPSDAEREAYIAFLREVAPTAPIKGVLLYGLARESMQPEARRLGRLPAAWLEEFAAAIRGAGVEVKVSP